METKLILTCFFLLLQCFQPERTCEQFSAKLLSAVYEGVKWPVSHSSGVINITPASQQLACKLLELAYALGLKVCCMCNFFIIHNINV